jgi:hypothetical protein
MKHSLVSSLLLFCIPLLASAQVPETVAAATKFAPAVKWKPDSMILGDFSCRRRVERVILGTNKSEIVVAIFLGPLTAPPNFLRYSSSVRDPATAELKTEDLDFEPKRFESEVGYIPDGLRPSRICKGLNLSDGKIDSVHIYWNHNANEFSDWVL